MAPDKPEPALWLGPGSGASEGKIEVMRTYGEPLQEIGKLVRSLSQIGARHRCQRRSYLSVIRGTRSEESLEGVVPGEKETGEVGEELASDVEEDEEEVDSDQTQDGVDLGDRGLTLKVVQDRVLGELSHHNVSQDGAQKKQH